MELHHPCVLSSNDTSLPATDRRILQESAGNGARKSVRSTRSWKEPPSPLKPAPNRHAATSKSIAAQESGFNSDRQIEYELQRLCPVLQNCPKYRKYRDIPSKAQKKEDGVKWPDDLERAFWRACIRWPPTGRNKYSINGKLSGRNQLVAESIKNETGVPRERKQVSSHLQVLRPMFVGEPLLLKYMSLPNGQTAKTKAKDRQLRAQGRGRAPPHSSRKDCVMTGAGDSSWPNPDTPYSRRMQSMSTPGASFTIAHFAMNVEDMNQQPLHYVTRLAELSRLRDQHFADLSMWHKQYPELNFHDTEKWKDRQVLVCHASLDLMEKQPSGAHLGIQYVLDAHRELGILEPLHCRTRFYDNTERVHDDVKKCDYASDTSYRLPFGSQFWVHRLNKLRKDLLFARSREDHVAARKHESQVQRSLQYMTAIQDIQGTRHDTGEEQPLLTVLWRFTFARTLDGPGRVTWRAVHFPTQAFNSWDGKAEDIEMSEDLGLMPSVYPSLPPELYNVSFQHCLSPLDLESLAHVPMEALNDFSNPASATAPSLATDYSQPQSLLSLAHSQDTHMDQTQDYQDANNIDFHGGSIAIQLGPPIDLDGFETYNDMHAASLHQLSALDPNGQAGSQGFGHFNQLDGGMSVPMTNCYPVKQWHFNDIISRMEGAAENLHSLNLQPHATSVEEHGIVGPGILHSTQLGQDGLWKLQSGFGCEDTHVGAMSNDVHRKERQAQEILELIERDQREAAGRF